MSEKKVEPKIMALYEQSVAIWSATLHQAICWNGKMGMEKTLIPAKTPGIKLSYSPHGIWMLKTDELALIPAPNVSLVDFGRTK